MKYTKEIILKQKNAISNKLKNKDTGLVIVLGCLLWYLHTNNILFVQISIIITIVSIAFPVVLKPVSILWYGLSEITGTIITRLLLSLIFFCIITPIGLIRRIVIKKQLQTEQWKQDTGSVFTEKNICFSRSDIENPF